MENNPRRFSPTPESPMSHLSAVSRAVSCVPRWALLLAAVSATGCGDPTEPELPASPVIRLSPTVLVFSYLGEETTVDVTVVEVDGAPFTEAVPELLSTDPDVVTVDSAGTVRAIDNGTAHVVAALPDARDSLQVTVRQIPTLLAITGAPDSVSLGRLGSSLQIEVTATDAGGSTVPGIAPGYASSDSLVVSIDSTGTILARSLGTAIVRATFGELADSVVVHVTQVSATVEITPAPDSIFMTALGDTVTISAEVSDSSGTAIPDAPLLFRSSDSSVAVVDSAGAIEAVDNGHTYVVAESGSLRDSVEVIVRQQAATVEVTPALDSIWALGAGPDLLVEALDARGHAMPTDSVAWASSDTSILVVDEEGRTTALADGTVIVTAALHSASGEATVVVDERGWISMSAEEIGGGRDSDGYRVTVGADTVLVSAGTPVVIPFVPTGAYTLGVEDVADHCLAEPAPAVEVAKGDTAVAKVRIRCSGRFAFVDRVPPTYDHQLHYLDELGNIIVLSQEEVVLGEYAWSPGGAWMAFAKSMDGNTDLYIVRADGTGERRLTFDPAEDITPTWSPDGSRIAFRRVGVGEGLWVVDIETGALQQLTSQTLTAGPDWSPSDEVIVFSAPGALEPWNPELWSVRADGTDLQQLTTDATGLGYRQLAWSLDGTRFAAAKPGTGVWDLFVMNADASNPILVASSEQASMGPSWSPDGTSIVFTKHDGTSYGAYVVQADGTGESALTPELSATSATYSADGTHVLFTWTDVAAINLDGTGLKLITTTSASEPIPRPGG